MVIAAAPASEPQPASVEQRMLLHGVSWKDYVILHAALDIPGLRMTYCEGMLELATSSFRHEADNKSISRLIEQYGFIRQLRLNGYGSPPLRREVHQRGAEPDECYCVERVMTESELPDIVLEVIHTNPLLDKLHVYVGLGVPEVWLFRHGEFEVYRLAGDHYDRIERSGFLPELDLARIARLAAYPDQQDALNELRGLLG
ncbi:MAG TPA: Uma2 family endonuclease [Kofleriaceae bacterium]|jgi:Uma2 family endonuclease|nr:Uma2 family endonuclease [Kofleriaceae bacterium]